MFTLLCLALAVWFLADTWRVIQAGRRYRAQIKREIAEIEARIDTLDW